MILNVVVPHAPAKIEPAEPFTQSDDVLTGSERELDGYRTDPRLSGWPNRKLHHTQRGLPDRDLPGDEASFPALVTERNER